MLAVSSMCAYARRRRRRLGAHINIGTIFRRRSAQQNASTTTTTTTTTPCLKWRNILRSDSQRRCRRRRRLHRARAQCCYVYLIECSYNIVKFQFNSETNRSAGSPRTENQFCVVSAGREGHIHKQKKTLAVANSVKLRPPSPRASPPSRLANTHTLDFKMHAAYIVHHLERVSFRTHV